MTPYQLLPVHACAFWRKAHSTQQASTQHGRPSWPVGLTSLGHLWLDDNPLAHAPLYRLDVLACFRPQQGLCLDGRSVAAGEADLALLRSQVRGRPFRERDG